MDKSKLIDFLNEDLASEYKSIVQYVHHIATITGPEYGAIAEELRSHVGQELEHALTLAEQIDFLGGTPTTDVPTVQQIDDPRRALEQDLELEEDQLERYRERVSQFESENLTDVAEAIRPLLEQTQDHVRELQQALGK
jgi:bacterioferritin